MYLFFEANFLEEKPPSFSLFLFSYLAYFQVKAPCKFLRSIKNISHIYYNYNRSEYFFIIIVLFYNNYEVQINLSFSCFIFSVY